MMRMICKKCLLLRSSIETSKFLRTICEHEYIEKSLNYEETTSLVKLAIEIEINQVEQKN